MIRRLSLGLSCACLLTAAALRAQAVADAFTDDIRQSDPRVAEVRARMTAGEAAPLEWRLRFSGQRDDYLAFYDLEGREIHYRFRRDRWDDLATRKVQDLISGQAYRVSGQFTGVRQDGIFIPVADPRFREALSDPNAILTYTFEAAFPLRLDQVLF